MKRRKKDKNNKSECVLLLLCTGRPHLPGWNGGTRMMRVGWEVATVHTRGSHAAPRFINVLTAGSELGDLSPQPN
jgi:hypothetical protein